MGGPNTEEVVRRVLATRAQNQNWWDVVEASIKEMDKRRKACKDRLDYLALTGNILLTLNSSIKEWLPWLRPQKAEQYSLEELEEICDAFLKATKTILKCDIKITKAHTSPEFVVEMKKKKKGDKPTYRV